MAEAETRSSTSTSERHEVSITVQQPQRVSLKMLVPPWVRAAAAHVGDAVADVVEWLPRGRSRVYDRDAIIGVAEDLILISVNMIDKLD
jgi:hypothetical protein